MVLFQLYLSGIYYGNLSFENGTAYQERQNVFTGELEPKTKITTVDNILYHTLYHIDVLALARNLDEYEVHVREEKSNQWTSIDGVHYLDWNKDNPFPVRIWAQRDKKFPLDILVEDQTIIGFTVCAREAVVVLCLPGKENLTVLAQWRKYYPKETCALVSPSVTYLVSMRDGVRLSTNVYLPKGRKGRIPTILVRTPYGKETGEEQYYRYVQRGYAVVIQDVRGRNDSEGLWEPCVHEIDDGDDTLNWIAVQPWSDGNVGTVGGSYLGFVQWAAAASGNSHLKAMVSVVTSGSPFVDIPRRGGAFVSGMLAWAFAVSQQKFQPELMVREDWDKVLDIRPLQEVAPQALGYEVPFLREWLEHYDYHSMWDRMNWFVRKEKIHVPALVMSGWYDDNSMGTTEALDIIKDYPPGYRKVILGPWPHSGNANRDLHGVPFGNNALRYDIDLIFLLWLDHWLRGADNGIESAPFVEYYSVGRNCWKTAENWPLTTMEAEHKSIYLSENGTLTFALPKLESCDRYVYDPADPAPHLIDMSENELGVPANYCEVEQRADVLCYTTQPFTEELTVTGDMLVEFYAGSDARDTDWIVRLTDVDETGNSIKLADGILSARYRNGFDMPVFMNEGEVYLFHIRTTKISNTFLKGHRLRLSITSGAKNFVFPNSNTEAGYNSMEYVKATNFIYHGGKYPSKVILTIEK